jgi:hypothetical protein
MNNKRIKDRKSQPLFWLSRTAPPLYILILLGLGLRLLGLSLQPLWWDEGFSLYFSTETPLRLLELTSLDIHPPLYYLLLQAWMAMVGIGAISARWLSVFIGVLTLPVAWWVAYPFVGRRVAWVTVWLLLLSPLHIFYSQEVRMYGLMTLLTLLAVGAWQRQRWLMLGFSVLAGMLTQYYFIFVALALALLVFRDVQKGRYESLRGPLRALIIALVGGLPWLIYALPRLIRYVGGKLALEADSPMTPLEFLPRHLVAWSVGHLESECTWLAHGTWLFVALVLLPLFRENSPSPKSHQAQESPSRSRLFDILLLWLIPTIGIFLVGLAAPFVASRIERQLLFVLPFFLMLVAQGLVMVLQFKRIAGLMLMLLLVLLNVGSLWGFYTVPRYPDEDYRPILADLGAMQGAGDSWLAIYEWQIGYLRAYLPQAHPTPILVPGTTPAQTDATSWIDNPQALKAGIEGLLTEDARLWFPAYQVKGRILEQELASALVATGVSTWDDWYGNTRLYLFGSVPRVPELEGRGQVEGVGELRAAALADAVASGIGIVPLFIEVDHVSDGLRASVQLVGGSDVWGEWDGELKDGGVQAGLLVAHGTPPGTYTMQLSLYHEGGKPLNRSQDGQATTPEAVIGQISVMRPPNPLPAAALRRLATTPLDITLSDTVRLLGISLPEAPQTSWLQGDSLPLTLFWQSLKPSQPDLHIFLQAIEADGTLRAARDLPPVDGTFPTSQWQAGDLVRDPHQLTLPADIPAGSYRLITGMYNITTGERLLALPPQSWGGLRGGLRGGRDAIELGTIQVEERQRLLEEPKIGKPIDIPFGQRVRLSSLQLPDDMTTELPLEVTLLWQASTSGGTQLRAFVQLYHNEQQINSSDHELDPPASAWINGEWIIDHHTVFVPNEPLAGSYKLVVGLYDAQSGERLPTPEGTWATVAEWIVGEE